MQHIIPRVLIIQDYLEKPLILENMTFMLEIPGTMSQTDFFQQLVTATGCGVLLDVTNVFINATNHQFDTKQFLEQMPLSHLIQVHLAGGYRRGGWLVDGHSELVGEEIFALFENLASLCTIKSVIFEHDTNFPPMTDLIQQMERTRCILRTIKKSRQNL